jgi:Flp pilus assembly protein TadG
MSQRTRGQALVEFGLVSVLLLIFILGVIDLAWLFSTRTQTYQATRAAARYAATHPTAWSNAANPDSTTIEGQLRGEVATVNIPNNDSHITISYWIASTALSLTECGHYSAATNAFVSDNGFSQASCLVPGTTIRIDATYQYGFITPLLKGAFPSPTITTSGAAMEEK